MANDKQAKKAQTRTDRMATRGTAKTTSGRDSKRQTSTTHDTNRKGAGQGRK